MQNERTAKGKKLLSLITAILVSLSAAAGVMTEDTRAAAAIIDSAGNQYSINAGTNTLTLTKGVNQESVVIPETVSDNGTIYTVTAIKDYAFPGFIDLETITIPKSVTSIGMLSRSTTPNFKAIIVDGDNPNYESENGVLFDKGKKNLLCYPEGKKDSSYTIPEGVESICKFAFADAISLEGVVIPESVTTISSAFYNCTGLKEITIPKNVSSIDSEAFYSCTSLTAFNVDPDSTYFESIDGVLFEKGLYKLCTYPPKRDDLSYSIPDEVEAVGDYAFFKCNNLTKIHIPDAVTTIGLHCFQNCANLKEINLPDSISSLGDYAFWSCIRLSEINLPKSINNIGSNVLSGCNALKKLVIPSNIQSISNHAISNCKNLTEIIVPSDVNSVGNYAFYNCSNLKEVVIPDGISLGISAFSNVGTNPSVFVMYDKDPSTETLNTSITKAFNGSVLWYRAQRTFSSPDTLTLTAKPGDTYNLYDALGVVNDIIYSGTAGNSPVTGIRVPFVLTGESSAGTYIDDQNVLHVGNDETGPLSIDACGRTAAIIINQPSQPSIPSIYCTLTADDLLFPDYLYGNTAQPLPLQIHCAGNTGTAITNVELDNDHFVIDQTAAISYVEAGKTNATYQLSPKAGLEPGTYTANIKITYGYGRTATAKVTCTVALAAPSKFKASSKDYRSIALSWQKVKGAEKYQVYRAVKKNGTYKRISTTAKTSLTNTKLTTGKRYYYKVRTYRTVNGKKAYSRYTDIVSAMPVPKTPVFRLKASDTRITVSWNRSSGASGYKIYRATSKKGKYHLIKDAKASQRSYTSTGLRHKKTYYYKMRTYKLVDGRKIHSAYSTVKKVTTK